MRWVRSAPGAKLDTMRWVRSWRADPRARQLADRHYSRQSIGTAQFVPPGRCLVLLTASADALWITSWQFAEHVRHAWPGAWVCSLFRNESSVRASELILEAVAATCSHFGEPPPLGMITFVDATKIRRTRQPGRCFRIAGFENAGHTAGGLVALRMPPEAMPAALAPVGSTAQMFPD